MAATVLVGAAAWYFLNFRGGVADDQATWGQFGDYMGGMLNPIFSLFALFALLYTIVLQVQELHETRQEMRRSVDVAKHQIFESTFFQMLRLHHEIIESLKVRGDDLVRGRETFERFCELLEEQFAGKSMYDPLPGSPERDRELIQEAWSAFFAEHYTELVHYFRNIYAIMKFVDDRAPGDQHQQYIRLLQAQLSVYEFKLIFYNGLQPKAGQFKALIEKHALLQNVAVNDDFVGWGHPRKSQISRNHYQFYEQSAYGAWKPPSPSYSDRPLQDDDKSQSDSHERRGLSRRLTARCATHCETQASSCRTVLTRRWWRQATGCLCWSCAGTHRRDRLPGGTG